MKERDRKSERARKGVNRRDREREKPTKREIER